MKLLPIDPAGRDTALRGDLGDLEVAPGWPHEDTAPGLSFLDAGGWGFLIIDDDGRVAGECGTKAAPDASGTVEIGYGLAPSSRGHGLGGRAVGALVERLAEQPEVTAVEAEVHVGNIASWRLLERLGFRQVGRQGRGYRRYRLEIVGQPEQRSPKFPLVRAEDGTFTRSKY